MWCRSLRLVAVALILGAYPLLQTRPACADNVADGMQRLFTDAETRARMDAARKGDPVSENINEDQPATKIRVDGVVIREHGDNVVWINGESSLNGNSAGGVQVRSRQIDRKNYRVPVRIDDQTVRMKPGQVWTGESGKVSDDY